MLYTDTRPSKPNELSRSELPFLQAILQTPSSEEVQELKEPDSPHINNPGMKRFVTMDIYAPRDFYSSEYLGFLIPKGTRIVALDSGGMIYPVFFCLKDTPFITRLCPGCPQGGRAIKKWEETPEEVLLFFETMQNASIPL